MNSPVNEPLSKFELVARTLNFPSNIKKNNTIKTGLFYPYNREDRERRGYYTNKISVVRLCRGVGSNGFPQWGSQVEVALTFRDTKDREGNVKEKRVFKGFIVVSMNDIIAAGLESEAAANEVNPFHAHLLIPDYNIKFQEPKRAVKDLLSQVWRARLDRLARDGVFVEFNDSSLATKEWEDICRGCRSSFSQRT